MQDTLGPQPIAEALEPSSEASPAESGIRTYDPDPSVWMEEQSVMSMLLPSDAMHKRFGFIFADTIKVRHYLHVYHTAATHPTICVIIGFPLNFTHTSMVMAFGRHTSLE